MKNPTSNIASYGPFYTNDLPFILNYNQEKMQIDTLFSIDI
jgi:hypothetical protein